MNYRLILLLALLLPLTAAEPPNVILMMTDDQGYGDFGITGNELFDTPNIDALAKNSASMSTFYVSPVCSPTRASLMTGRYNYRTRCIDTYLGRSMMDTDEVTIAECLKTVGYSTGIFGKWHLGDNYPMRPMDQGFDESLIHLGGGLAQPADPLENQSRYTDPILFHNGKQTQTTGYCTDVYTDAALDFIEKQKAAKKRFFIYLATNAPHGPFHDVPKELYESYMKKDLTTLMRRPVKDPKHLAAEQDKLARIAAMITNEDDNVGRLMARLKELGLLDNTLVIRINDNGPNTPRYVGPFRGNKTLVHEGGVRSPLWMHWPDGLEAGTSSAQIAAHIDIMPTLLDICGAKPGKHKMDGRSFYPVLKNPKARLGKRSLVIQTHRGDVPVRYHHFMIREGKWKLLNNSGFGKEALPGEPEFELYNLATDPGELKNQAENKPEIVAQLKATYDLWFDDVSNTRPDNYAPPRIIVGSPHENPTVLSRQDWRGNGWSPTSTGHWFIEADKAVTADVKVIFHPDSLSEKAGKATLELQGKSYNVEIAAHAKDCLFEGIKLDAGPATVNVTCAADEQPIGVYHVEVHAK